MKALALPLLFCLSIIQGFAQPSKQLTAPSRHFDDQRVQEFYDGLAARFPVVVNHGKACFFVKDARFGDDLYLDVSDAINWWSVQYYRRRYGIPSTSGQLVPVDAARPQRPSRPTTAVEVYHYVMSAFPLRQTDELRYEQVLPGGAVMYSPYSVTEEQANERLRGYYNHPLPGTSREKRRDLGLLVELLSPSSQAELAAVVPTGANQASGTPAYTMKVKVKGIPDTATMFVSSSAAPKIEAEAADLGDEHKLRD